MDEHLGEGIAGLKRLQKLCAKLTFADEQRFDRQFQQVTQRGGESAINYIKRFQNAKSLAQSVGNTYSEEALMHMFLDNFHQAGKYSAQVAAHQAELRREEFNPSHKSLSLALLQTDRKSVV